MSNERDGGPAFPTHKDAEIAYVDHSPGMSLRDWFAGQAMEAIIGKIPLLADNSVPNTALPGLPEVEYEQGIGIRRAASVLAYKYADAMLAAREARS